MPSIRRRLEVLELQVDASEMAPDRIRAAMTAWKERGELPAHPELRKYIVDLYAAIDRMEASVPVAPPEVEPVATSHG